MAQRWIPSPGPLAGRLRRALIQSVAVIAALSGLLSEPARAWFETVPLPSAAPAPSPYETLIDLRPVTFSMTVQWAKVPVTTSAEELASNPLFWRNMHFDDWDRLPAGIRDVALLRMMQRYSALVRRPDVWALLTPADWDRVPQPVRSVIYTQMVEHWAKSYGLTNIRGLNPRDVLQSLNAIMMAESWFEHRGININEWGNRDLGLGGCSDKCRRIIGEMAQAGDLDFALTEDDYFNPWHATRALVVWFGLELARANCDLDYAIAAYHRGHDAALDAKGIDYLNNVNRLKRRYFGEKPASPTLQNLREWASEARLQAEQLLIAG